MSNPAHLEPKPRARDLGRAEVSVPNDTASTWTDILTVRARFGFDARLAYYRQAWDPAGDGSIFHRLLVNGVPHPDITGPAGSDVQEAAPEQNVFLPVPIPIPQGAEVKVQMRNTDTLNDYDGVATLGVYYFDLESAP